MKQIIAMGGGRMSLDRDHVALGRYVCGQSGRSHPKICFLPQASGEAEAKIVRFYEIFTGLKAVPSYLSLFHPPTADLASFVLEHDIIYVGGGNTKSMLALWRDWGLDVILRQAWERGIVMAGSSAGAICWFEQGSTDSIPGRLSVLDCLGLVPGSCCPHYDGEAKRRPSYHELIASGEILPGYGVDEGAALHFVDDAPPRVITSHSDVTAYVVEMVEGEVRERALEPTYIGEMETED